MPHTVKSKTQLVARVRRIAGQLKRIEVTWKKKKACHSAQRSSFKARRNGSHRSS